MTVFYFLLIYLRKSIKRYARIFAIVINLTYLIDCNNNNSESSTNYPRFMQNFLIKKKENLLPKNYVHFRK